MTSRKQEPCKAPQVVPWRSIEISSYLSLLKSQEEICTIFGTKQSLITRKSLHHRKSNFPGINKTSMNEDFSAPPPLGPELFNGKWNVQVIDDDGNITLEKVTGKQVWSMQKRRVIVNFNRRGQPIKDSGGLLGSWLGSLSYDLNILPINYTDWRKVPNYRKEMAWAVIQKKFWFDDPMKRKKYVMSTLGVRCRDLKQRFWKIHKRNTPRESIEARPTLIPEDQWIDFVHSRFTDKAKKLREVIRKVEAI
ncbi:unnamed protein product [Microthlaspi erraticum]|uniref:Uncharacterized protein n=1 Tax=Microthlaspi erraticum TaxID=1685480 RepID=A0A6D2HHL2_9BRAS|nr:unnamed protein product [Microthlaspi erraticum]